MAKPALTTSKMPGETEQQYTAWLLYCEYGSIEKLHRTWQETEGRPKATERRPEFEEIMGRLGKSPALTTVKEWSAKFRWVERKDLKLQSELEELHRRAGRVVAQKKQKIVIAFGRILDDLLKKIESKKFSTENMTMSDLKKLWEMARTELGETLGKHEVAINEDEQKPPTPEEREFGKAVDQAIKEFYGRRGKEKTKK
jgi:molecular chaperone GrpE (heat shock protein)